jgi:hypothetical protein
MKSIRRLTGYEIRSGIANAFTQTVYEINLRNVDQTPRPASSGAFHPA